jgi:hypothetical protein
MGFFDLNQKIKKNQLLTMARPRQEPTPEGFTNGLAYIERIARGTAKGLFRVAIVGDPAAILDLPHYLNDRAAKDIFIKLLDEGFKPSPSYYESDFMASFLRRAFPDIEVVSESELNEANLRYFASA